MSDSVKLVPALCTQCGGRVEVVPSEEKATCPYCGTSFIIDRAVYNYNVENAKIEHADNVNIELKGAVDSVLDFAGRQLSESREFRKELKKEQALTERIMLTTFFKIFGIICVVMIVLWFVMSAFGLWDDDEADPETGQVVYECTEV